MEKSYENSFLLIFVAFIAAISVVNVISAKVVTLFGLTFSVGALVYPITFVCTDTTSEIWGKGDAKKLVWYGLLANVIVVAFIVMAAYYPPADVWSGSNESFKETLLAVPRVFLASMTAYLISQLHDVWAFHFWKGKTEGKLLWLRNNLSTATSQLIDTTVFVLIAFTGTMPASGLVTVIFGQYVLKLGIAVVDTPVVYLVVKAITGKWAVTSEKPLAAG
jgi:uncharacterized integral membrane protein (TIGR00697 family)